jgi:hypothetical protein
MEFKNTLEILHANSDEIRKLIARLEKTDEIRTIELDLILEKLRDLYDLTLDLQTVLKENGISLKENIDKVKEEEITQTAKPVVEKSPEKIQQERKTAAREQVERDLKKKGPSSKEPSEKTFVSDRFKTSKPTLNEDLASKIKSEDLSSKLKAMPITNISNALGLNDKFELINELFNGDKELFERTMQVLNMAGSFVEAYNYLNENFDWDMSDPHVQRILELIRRKLIVRRNDQ